MNRNVNPLWGYFLVSILGFVLFLCIGSFTDVDEKQVTRSPHHKHEFNDFFFSTRNYPEDKPNLNAYLTQLKAISGRINTIAIHPTNSNIMYAGASNGGIFKTTNGGSNWQSIFDEQTLLSIGKIIIDPINPNIIYAGTGDVNISALPSVGNGLYKSTDAGITWKNIGLDYARIISDIYVNPKNTQEIYAAAMGLPFKRNADRGLYKTVDGGQSWDQILYISNEVGIIDIAVHCLCGRLEQNKK